MHPLTLQFKDKKLAQQYREQEQFARIQYFSMIGVCLILLLLTIITILTNLNKITHLDIIFNLSLGICSFFGIITILKYPQLANLGLFFINLSIMSIGIQLPTGYNRYHGYLLGCCSMMAHAFLLFIMKFKSSILNNCLLCFLQLFFCYYNANLSVLLFIIVITASLTFNIALYLIEKLKRQSFLINIKENILCINLLYKIYLEILISECIGKPLFIFYYNQQNSMFNALIEDKNYNFQNLLTTQISKKYNLKEYIYKKLKYDNIDAQYFKVQINNQNHVIRLQKKLIYFILSIETKDKFVSTLVQQQQNYSIRISKYIQQMLRNISHIVGHKKIELNYKLHHGLYQIIDYMNPQNPIGPLKKLFINKINLKSFKESTNLSEKLMKFCIKTNKFHNIHIRVNIKSDIMIACSPYIVNIYLLEIFKNFREKQNYFVKLNEDQETIKMEILGKMKLDQTQIFQKYSNILVSNVISIEQGFQFTFYKESQLSFYYYK